MDNKGGKMKNCGTCKHWLIHGKNAVWGDCQLLYGPDQELFDVYIHCGNAEIDIETHPDFGCVLWENKK